MISRKSIILFLLLCPALVIYCCAGNKKDKQAKSDWQSIIPPYIKDSIYFDKANPFTKEKSSLGRYLFYDRRLSVNQSKSCASCHDPKYSFTDNYRRSIGALGDLHQRNASPLINIIFRKYLTAADSSLHYPEQQILNPLFHENPVELGWKGNETIIINRIKKDNLYKNEFEKIFPGQQEPVTAINIQYCITTFVKTIISLNAPYDQYINLKNDRLTAAAKRGMQLFFSNELNCRNCHGGIDFATPSLHDSLGNALVYFNTGLYNTDSKGSYPAYDQGLVEHTGRPSDMGKYKVPTLRNLSFTAPYYHDGSAVTLEQVVRNYENGGQSIDKGPFHGNGTRNPYKSPLIKGFSLTSQQRKDIIEFLFSLSDSSVLKNENFSNPFHYDETSR